MATPVIEIESISKSYLIGQKVSYGSLREEITRALAAPFRRRSKALGLENDENKVWALKDVSFDVHEGEVVGIIGRNGAGKSTLLKILSRITDPTEGRITMRGRMASLLEVGTGFHPELTGRENIFLNGALLGMRNAEIRKKFDEIVDFSEIEKFLDTPVKRYSSGMYVRLAFAVAAHLEPEILVIDEVLAVGDAAFQKKCLGKIGDVAKGGRTVLFVSHNMAAVRSLCTRAVLLTGGLLDSIGNISEITDKYASKIYELTEKAKDIFPIYNSSQGVGIEDCNVILARGDNNQLNLEVDLTIKVNKKHNLVGVGMSLFTTSGIKVCELGPAVTNYVLENATGLIRCGFRCLEIDRYLAGGDYVLGVWLSKPRTEFMVKVDDAALISIPAKDSFSTGVGIEARKHGLIPLPLKFHVQTDKKQQGDSK